MSSLSRDPHPPLGLHYRAPTAPTPVVPRFDSRPVVALALAVVGSMLACASLVLTMATVLDPPPPSPALAVPIVGTWIVLAVGTRSARRAWRAFPRSAGSALALLALAGLATALTTVIFADRSLRTRPPPSAPSSTVRHLNLCGATGPAPRVALR